MTCLAVAVCVANHVLPPDVVTKIIQGLLWPKVSQHRVSFKNNNLRQIASMIGDMRIQRTRWSVSFKNISPFSTSKLRYDLGLSSIVLKKGSSPYLFATNLEISRLFQPPFTT